MSQSSTISGYLLALRYNLPKLYDLTLEYLKRTPLHILKEQKGFSELDQSFIVELLTEKCEKLESRIDDLRDVRMVLERKQATTFPGIQLLCNDCVSARKQQVDCSECMKACSKKISAILRSMER